MSAATGDDLMRLFPLLVNYARRRLPTMDRAICEDLAATAVEKALTRYHGDRDGLTRWLLAVVRNAATDWLRLKSRTDLPLLYVDVLHGRLDAGSDRHADWLDLSSALGRITPRQRERIERYEAGYTHDETAAEAGTTYKAQKSRRAYAIRSLRAAMHAEATP